MCSRYPVPNLLAYDPAFAYEIAIIIQDGIRRMYVDGESIFYYMTVSNEPWPMPEMPEPARHSRGHPQRLVPLTGLPRRKMRSCGRNCWAAARSCSKCSRRRRFWKKNTASPPTFGASPATKNSIATATIANAGTCCIPTQKPKVPYVTQTLQGASGPFMAASDYMKVLPETIAQWVPGRLVSLGTDGFGRSENRASLRDFFEVDAKHIVLATLHALGAEGRKPWMKAIRDLGINPEKRNPATS